jgi:hypothetical protein
MSEPETVAAAVKEPKKRGKRRQSDYIVLEVIREASGSVHHDYSAVSEGPSVKACIKSIEEKKIAGELIIVCVRRRITSTVKEVVELS